MIDLSLPHLAIVERILAEHVPEYEVRASDSRATWTPKEYSDLDLAVIGKGPLARRTLRHLKKALDESDLPMRVDVLDWHSISDSFRAAIERDHVVVQETAATQRTTKGTRREIEQDWLYNPRFPDAWDRWPLYSLARWVNGLAFRNIEFSPDGDPVIKIAEIKGGISGQTKFTQQRFDESVRIHPGDLLFSWSGHPETSINAFWWQGPEGWLNQHIFRVTTKSDVDTTFFYYLLRYLKPNFVGIARNKQTTGLGHVTKQDLENISVSLPPLDEQRAIAHILGTIDDKIELNRRMSKSLEAMARALFQSWFVDFDPVRAKMEGGWRPGESLPGLPDHLYPLFPDRLVPSELGDIPEGWEVKGLDGIADFTNGLALQRFPPEGDEWLPIIKIAEMRRGYTEKTAKASPRLDPKYIVEDGDAIFSWSGSLEFVLWSHGPGALNQHLFKVTSGEFPRWFYCGWLYERLDDFRAIAAGKATTMGHIQRHHLTDAKVVVPRKGLLAAGDATLAPLAERQISLAVQNRTLATLRDVVLPKLVAGELNIGAQTQWT